MERFNSKNPLYPLLGLIVSLTTLIFGLVMAKSNVSLYFLISIYLLFLLFGYWRACLGVVPIMIMMCTLFGAFTYFTGFSTEATATAIRRSLIIGVTFIPGLSISTTLFIRNMQQLKFPRGLTLGMMIALNFFPLFSREMKQIKEAMKTRGISTILNFKVLYRAFLVPLVMRIVNISDTLALSVETRGFTLSQSEYTVYNPVKFKMKDLLFCFMYLGIMVLVII